DSQSADGSAQAAGFYGIAYTLEADGALKTVISYRGTDNYNPFAAGNDILNGWTTSAGFANQSQAKLAIDFYQAVTERDAHSTGAPPNVI
ncbi:hypothetical protein, partial [Pseudomonas sp. MPR-R2A6]|uniref:hypothetical protein n=1 Tax=Pseudomonas sp. MPR-R2A6 TaxID=2070627 RepID=UPI000CC926F5